MTSPEYQAPTWVNEDDPAFIEGVSPDLGAGYLNELSGAVEDHGQRLGAITPVVTYLNANAISQDAGDNRWILQDNAVGFAPAEATANALAALPFRADNVTTTGAAVDDLVTVGQVSPFSVTTKSLAELVDTTPITAADVGALPATTKLAPTGSPALTGRWYVGRLVTQIRTVAPPVGQQRLTPCYTEDAITIDALSMTVSVADATAVYRMGIWLPADQDEPFGLTPASRLYDAGTLSCATTGVRILGLATQQTIPARSWFFVSGVMQTAAATISVGGNSALRGWSPLGINGASGTYDASPNIALEVTGITGALPASSGALAPTNVDAGVAYRRAS